MDIVQRQGYRLAHLVVVIAYVCDCVCVSGDLQIQSCAFTWSSDESW